MTLASHLLSAMDPNTAPIQTPHRPGYHQAYTAQTPRSVVAGNDGSQFGAHHGSFPPPSPWAMLGDGGGGFGYGMPTPGRFTEWSADRVSTMQARLQRRLGPEYVTTRPGPGGGPKLSYIEGWKVVNLANEVFGFNGWSSSIKSLKTDFLDVNKDDRVFVGITAIVRVTLQDGCYHEDIGYGHAENVRGKAAALEKAQKEAVTDAIKRTLKHFGNVLGNCLYDKEYTKQVGRINVPPAKFNVDELERRPEFTPQGAMRPPAPPPQSAPAIPQHVSGHPKPAPPARRIETPRAETPPLRSVDETDMNVDTSEFADMEEDSFMDFEESILATKAGGNVPMLGEKPAPPAAPAYQHRHRPDVPAVRTDSSSSESSDGQPAPKRAVGGFAMPNKPGSTMSAERRKAMLAAMNGEENRPPQPQIPAGDIDAVAARAQSNIHAHGANLDIHSDADQHGGFTSARAMKRDGESPVKWDRSAVREALAAQDANKRPRVG